MVGMSSRREKSIEAKRPDGYRIEKRGEVLGITEMPQQFGRHWFHENEDYVFTAGLPRIVYFSGNGRYVGERVRDIQLSANRRDRLFLVYQIDFPIFRFGRL